MKSYRAAMTDGASLPFLFTLLGLAQGTRRILFKVLLRLLLCAGTLLIITLVPMIDRLPLILQKRSRLKEGVVC